MDRYMITHSLLSSWLYSMKDNPYEDIETAPEDPLADFMKVLRREHTEPTDAMLNGIMFEDLVTAITENQQTFGFIPANPKHPEMGMVPMEITDHTWYAAANEVAQIVNGGLLQVKCAKTITVSGMNILLYGRLDALKAGSIYDIKFSKGYERGKYLDSTQHPVYMELVPEAQEFTYLVSNGTDVWTETYRRDEVRSIYPTIIEFLEWLNSTGFITTFREKWLAL